MEGTGTQNLHQDPVMVEIKNYKKSQVFWKLNQNLPLSF